MDTCTSPGPVLGVVGGGQLGRMLAEAAAPIGVEIVVLDPTDDCPAAPVSRDQIVGDFTDESAIRELAERADVLTFEIELADPDLLDRVQSATDVPIHPSTETLRQTRDKLLEKQLLADHDVPTTDFHRVTDAADLESALEAFDGGAMLKARRGGYDGRGNIPVRDPDHTAEAVAELGVDAMAEAIVDFAREISVIGVKGRDEIRSYVAGETIHEEEILRETVVPARSDATVRDLAQSVARDVLELLDGRGTFGIELFETTEGDVLVNEIAPRPHNSGHWTIEGAPTSQFENHVRAVMGLPLGRTEPHQPTVSKNILGDDRPNRPAKLRGVDRLLAEPFTSLHWYGKREVRPLRKMGHFTVVGFEETAQDELLEAARTYRGHVEFE